MSQKIIDIPIAPHLVKFLEVECPKKGDAFIIRKKIIPPRYMNPRQYRRYFTHPSDRYIYIKVVTNDSRLYKLYAWVQHIDHRFSDKMIDYVAARYGLQYDSDSLREFLSLYDITESEYAHDTAYKKWQRSPVNKRLRAKKKEQCQE